MYLKEPYRTTASERACQAENAYPLGRRVISGQRYLHTELGRWTRRDPLGEEADTSLLVFVLSDPINKIDAIGEFSLTPMGRCQDAIEQIEEEFGDQIEHMREDCNLGTITCRRPEEDDGDSHGGYNPVTGDIELITQGFRHGVGGYKTSLIHELQHAFESCRSPGPNVGVCQSYVCRELRAYYCENFDRLNSLLTHELESHREAAREWLRSAVWGNSRVRYWYGCSDDKKDRVENEEQLEDRMAGWCPIAGLSESTCWFNYEE